MSVIAGVQENLALALNPEKVESDLLKHKYKVFSRFADEDEKRAFHAAKSVRDLDVSLWQIGGSELIEVYHFYVLPKSRPLDCEQGVIGNRAGVYLATEDYAGMVPVMTRIVADMFVREEAVGRAYHSAAGVLLDQTDRDSMRTLKSEPAYDITLTLLSPRPDLTDLRWDVQKAISVYLKPFLDAMAPYVVFHIKSQVLYYVDLHVEPQNDAAINEFYLKHSDLPLLINPIERELASFTSNLPGINLVVYATPPQYSPLYIRDQKGGRSPVNAFLSPRWGGMMVYNVPVPGNATSYPVRVDLKMKEIMEVLVTQLRLLVGLESSMPATAVRDDVRDMQAVSYWELAFWLRKRALENCGVATVALTSLSQLLATISNIVINDDIAQEIRAAIGAVRESRTSLLGSRIDEAFAASKQALIAAETAFFDQSLLELLYFPEDQKFAIYIPLFLPISLPVVISVIQAIKWIKQSGKTEKQKTS